MRENLSVFGGFYAMPVPEGQAYSRQYDYLEMSGTQMVNNDKKRPNQTEHNEALERLRSWLEIPSAERVLTITALELGEEVRLLQICFLAEDLFHGDRQAAR